ncbi:MAG: tRNA adenosine(34) deaminase TadA [Planctomycetota bacterium]
MPDSEEPLPATDSRFMRLALQEARAALDEDEVPVGAVIIHEGRLIARAHNQKETLTDPTAHAEMIAITQATEAVGDWRLSECTLYVTLEPCLMCAGAMILARLGRLVFGATDPKAGAVSSLYQVLSDARLNHRVEITPGVLAEDCGALLSAFFASKRDKDLQP